MPQLIKVEGLSKRYRITPNRGSSYSTLRDEIAGTFQRAARAPLRLLRRDRALPFSDQQDFWALKDVSFEINEGERLGIIGRNGAGKSTLLKVLSRITAPTTGRISITGRVASLLEVGTGFHPELTGRENIFLNGAILGMTRAEVRRKFDEIVSFAEIERFIDTPVKQYSSGMYVRLAFSVAAHLEPEILIVDEVLAVGDMDFQRKCLSRMGEIGSSGRTVVFVSHNMSAIQRFCNSALFLKNGCLIEKSHDVPSLVRAYSGGPDGMIKGGWVRGDERFSNPWFTPTRFYVSDAVGSFVSDQAGGVSEPVYLCVEGVSEKPEGALQVGVNVYSEDGVLVFWSYSTDDDDSWVDITKGMNRLIVEIPAYLLNEGVYRVELGIALYHRMWICEPGANSPSISLCVQGGFLASKYWTERRPGILATRLRWKRMEV